MSELVHLHSRLSSIMEMLANTAVAEITKLIDDYTAVLRLELSRRKDVHNILHGKQTELPLKRGRTTLEPEHRAVLPLTIENKDQLGSGNVPSLQQSAVLSNTAAKEETRCRGLVNDSSLSQPINKQEMVVTQQMDRDTQVVVDLVEGKDIKNALLSSSSPLVAKQQPPSVLPSPLREALEEEWKFHVPQAVLEQEPYLDTIESEKDLYDNQPADIELNLKMEPESPDQPSQFDEGHPGFEVHTGTLSQSYPDYNSLFLGAVCPNSPEPGPFNSFSSRQQPHASKANIACGLPASDDNPYPCRRVDHPGIGGGGEGSPGPTGGRGPKSVSSSRYSDWSARNRFKFVCSFCSKPFVYQSELKRHTLIHTKERAYRCAHCGRSFIRSSHLRRHELLHGGQQRRFPCPQCGQAFCKSAQLDTHMKSHCG